MLRGYVFSLTPSARGSTVPFPMRTIEMRQAAQSLAKYAIEALSSQKFSPDGAVIDGRPSLHAHQQ